jgi:hypothetical protein
MNARLKELLARVEDWPESDQAELAEILEEIEIRHRGEYRATADELQALDEAEASGIANDQEVEAAFASFRRSWGLSSLSAPSPIFEKLLPTVAMPLARRSRRPLKGVSVT